jgi:hypothetical protein
LSFPRYFVCPQMNFIPPAFPDFSQLTGDRISGLVTHSRALKFGGFDYKKHQYIRSLPASFQHG